MPLFPAPDHDHRFCVARILATAEHLCAERAVRLTAQRRRVLEIVSASHTAIGAYAIMDKLGGGRGRPAPISIYRALDFLMTQNFVHRLASRNAYVACSTPRAAHGAQFLICERCGTIAELSDSAVDEAIIEAAKHARFAVTRRLVEVAGICAYCSGEGSHHAPCLASSK